MAKFKIVQISTPWCGPCKMARQLLTKFTKESELEDYYEYLDDDVDPNRFLDFQMKYKVRQVPRFIVVSSKDEFLDDLGSDFKKAIQVLNNLNLSSEEEWEVFLFILCGDEIGRHALLYNNLKSNRVSSGGLAAPDCTWFTI